MLEHSKSSGQGKGQGPWSVVASQKSQLIMLLVSPSSFADSEDSTLVARNESLLCDV